MIEKYEKNCAVHIDDLDFEKNCILLDEAGFNMYISRSQRWLIKGTPSVTSVSPSQRK